MNIINVLIQRLRDALTPSVGSIVSSISKLEAKLEASIKKELTKLQGLRQLQINVNNQIEVRNRDLDAAYRLLHNVSKVTK